ncbi:TIGR00703 family protein [Hippea sp. KM1]|uniref:TIGR00703 family protein n=1 Tax=Hippea sp. KM1 TaxID=944481 RepID=UPI00046D25CE|nr:TIGR00703 family protein [Hippea sp. KM1]
MSYKKTVRELSVKHQRMLNTFVRESWGVLPDQLEVKLKSLKAWGFDLLFGLRGGVESVFVSEVENKRSVGDKYEENGEEFEVKSIPANLKEGAKLIIKVDLEDRRGTIRAYYSDQEHDDTLLFSLPAAELLLVYFKKNGFDRLLSAFRSSGLTTEFIQKNTEEGKAYDFDQLPLNMRRALREAKDLIRKHLKSGRFSLAYFGQNKDKKNRYMVSWIVPTICLFDVDIAEKLNRMLDSLD